MGNIQLSVRRGENDWTAEFSYRGTHVVSGTTWVKMAENVSRVLVDKGADIMLGPIKPEWVFADPDLNQRYRELVAARRAANDANSKLDTALRAAARSFAAASTTRDAGAILGYSHQYISKVAK